MKSLKALRDSRKFFLTFAVIGVVTFFYLRLDGAAPDFTSRMSAFQGWSWIVATVAAAYMGANAFQNAMGGSNGPHVETTIYRKGETDIPLEK